MKIACIGEAMIELSLTGNGSQAQMDFAGDTLNTAVYLKRSLDDLASRSQSGEYTIAYVTALGIDSFSDQIIEKIHSEGLDCQFIMCTADRVPGLYAIRTDANGERSFTYWRDRSAARLLFSECTGPSFEQLEQFDLIYYSGITLAILPTSVKERLLTFLTRYRQQPGKQVSFDSNYRPRLWSSPDEARHYTELAWRQCDIALPSVDDEMALFNDKDEESVVARFCDYGIAVGAIKRGASGPQNIGNSTGGNNNNQYSHVENIVDSTAAGDSFNGAYLASIMTGQSAIEAQEAGHLCAARVLQYAGAIVDKDLWSP